MTTASSQPPAGPLCVRCSHAPERHSKKLGCTVKVKTVTHRGDTWERFCMCPLDGSEALHAGMCA